MRTKRQPGAVALHEAAHAAIALELGLGVDRVSTEPDPYKSTSGRVLLEGLTQHDDLRERLVTMLAGPAMDDLAGHSRQGTWVEREEAWYLASIIARQDEDRTKTVFIEAQERAQQFVETHESSIRDFAAILHQRVAMPGAVAREVWNQVRPVALHEQVELEVLK